MDQNLAFAIIQATSKDSELLETYEKDIRRAVFLDIANGAKDSKDFLETKNTAQEHIGDMGKVSDGCHTFDELYDHRCTLFVALMIQNTGISWFSRKHSDGDMWDGCIIAGMDLPDGPVTYHLPVKYVEIGLLDSVKELELGKVWDGHDSNDVLIRLTAFVAHEIEKKNCPLSRLVDEISDLKYRFDKLVAFIRTDKFTGLSDIQRESMQEQEKLMLRMIEVLELRLANW